MPSRSATERWNACWAELRDEHPELFHRDFRRSLTCTDALSYLYVRERYPEFVPPLKLTSEERAKLGRLRMQFEQWTGLPALSRPASLRLIRSGCPILDAERASSSPDRAACTFGWSPGPVRRVVLVYEDRLIDWRQRGWQFLLLSTLLHEEIHSAVHLAAGGPELYAIDDEITPLVEELCVTLLSNIAQLFIDSSIPPRHEVRRWNAFDKESKLNVLLRAIPGQHGDEVAASAAELAIATVSAGSADAVLELLAARSDRSARWWARALE